MENTNRESLQFRVVEVNVGRDSYEEGAFSNYKFEIFLGDQLVAYYFWAQHGNGHLLELIDRRKFECPLGPNYYVFYDGKRLSAEAIKFLEQLLETPT